MKKSIFLIFITSLTAILLSNLQHAHNLTYQPPGHFWSLDTLRGIDSIDTLQTAEIVAYYARSTPDALQLRVDFLELMELENNFLYLESSQNAADLIPLFPNQNKTNFFMFLNPQQNYIVIQLPKSYRNHEFRFIVKNQDGETIESTSYFSLYSKTPNPIQVNLLINNTQLGDTPAQILRNWDGAHTGPKGQRFGLSHLLSAIQKYNIPITFTDFVTPDNISALNLLEQTTTIRMMQEKGLLKICAPTYPNNENVSHFNELSARILSQNKLLLQPNCNFEPISVQTEQIIFNDYGLSSQTQKELLMEYDLNDEQIFPIFVSLVDSLIGDFNTASVIFDFLKNHPWIQFSLLNNTTNQNPTTTMPPAFFNNVTQDLFLSRGPFQTDAIIHFYNLTEPGNYQLLQPLLPTYISEIYYYLEANQWTSDTTSTISCQKDINQDQHADCVISNQYFFVIIDLNTASVPFIAVKNKKGAFYQIVGSSSQIMFGLSPSQEWDLSAQGSTDPAVISGINTDTTTTWDIASISPDLQQLVFSNSQSEQNMIISLHDDQLSLEYFSPTEITNLTIPFLLTQSCRYTPDWANHYIYQKNQRTESLACLDNKIGMKISGNLIESQHHSIKDVADLIQIPENPDFQYPEIHYYPSGLSISQLSFHSNLKITFQIPYDEE